MNQWYRTNQSMVFLAGALIGLVVGLGLVPYPGTTQSVDRETYQPSADPDEQEPAMKRYLEQYRRTLENLWGDEAPSRTKAIEELQSNTRLRKITTDRLTLLRLEVTAKSEVCYFLPSGSLSCFVNRQ